MEQPRLRVQAGRRHVVGDPDLGAEVDQQVERLGLGRAGVGGRQHPQPPAPARSASRSASASGQQPAAPNERHHDVDRVRRFDLGQDLLPTRGSPGAFVSSVVSSSGISGPTGIRTVPSGRHSPIPYNASPEASGAPSAALPCGIRSPTSSTAGAPRQHQPRPDHRPGRSQARDEPCQVLSDPIRCIRGPQDSAVDESVVDPTEPVVEALHRGSSRTAPGSGRRSRSETRRRL